MTLSAITCASGCVQRDRHLTACPCADPQHEHAEPTTATYQGPAEEAPGWSCHWCSGCLPKLAAPGLAVCWTDRNRAERDLTELAGLWADLAERPRLASVSKAPDGEGDSPPDPMTDKRRHARSAIKAMLVTWCITLAEDYAITVPDEAEIARTSRNIAAWYSDQAAQAQQAVRLLEMPTVGPLVRDPEGAAALRVHVKQHAAEAAKVRDDRETGRDILAALATHIGRHLDALLAGEHADQLCADLTNAASEARRCAYPSRGPAVRVTCECGSSVPVELATDMTCPACGSTAVFTWWREHQDHEAAQQPATAVDLAGWLLVVHGIDLGAGSHARIRQWAVRYPTEVIRAGRNDKGHVVYERPGVLAVAKRLAARKGAAA